VRKTNSELFAEKGVLWWKAHWARLVWPNTLGSFLKAHIVSKAVLIQFRR
jgi:hypothetical protein